MKEKIYLALAYNLKK